MSLGPLRQARIRFLHPGYPDDQNTLLDLPRVDPGPSNVGGTRMADVHHSTALVACQITANHAFDGRLAQDAGGQHLDKRRLLLLYRRRFSYVPIYTVSTKS